MNKLNYRSITLFFMLTALTISPLLSRAQTQAKDTGTLISDVSFTDIKGNKTSLYSYLAQGYMVVLELGLTTCNICWQYHNSGLSEVIYRKYGPNGSVLPKKIMPMFIECNPQTTSADLNGKGPNTMGDWVSGRTFPIVDLTSENYASTLKTFLKNTSFPTPTFVIICPDGKLVFSGEGASAGINEKMLVGLMNGRCTQGEQVTTAIGDISSAASVKVYPNPVSDMLYIESSDKIHLTILDMQGREMLKVDGAQTIPLSGLAKGTYLLRIMDKDDRLVRMEKLVKQ